MTRKEVKNVAASVRQRLLNTARATSRPFNEVLQYYAMERFLYRLSRTVYRDDFVLKGALMLAPWQVSLTRPTKDIDLLGHVANDVGRVEAIVKDVCRKEVEPDGLDLDPESIRGERIAEEAEYEGIRVRLRGNLGTARVGIQIDIGFGDAVVPGPVTIGFPTILDLPAPLIRAYTRESAIAEKFHTMVRRGFLNSRMRDFFDIWALTRQFDFEGAVLAAAVRETFARRDLEVTLRPVALTNEFATDHTKAVQWQGFLRKNRLVQTKATLAHVVEEIAAFLEPVAEALHERREFRCHWKSPGPWVSG